jgi:uncharacterized circularly permuted ATP-grasp superfamily protein
MRSVFIKPFTVIICILFVAISLHAQGPFYNEIFDGQGNVRPHYREVLPLWIEKYSEYQQKFRNDGNRKFEGDNPVESFPRVLPFQDFVQVVFGAEQRARALQAFFADHYSGKKSYAKAGIISEETVNRIIARNGETGYDGRIDPAVISFLYGPDVIRDASGIWRVIEDNVGYVGGLGDLVLAQKIMLEAYPELKKVYKIPAAIDFYKDLVKSYKKRAREFGSEKVILLSMPKFSSDNEDKRVVEIFESLGIESITPQSSRQIKITDKGVFIVDKNGHKQGKVGFIILNAEHADMEPSDPAAYEKAILDQASGLLTEDDVPKKIKRKISEALFDVDKKTFKPDTRLLAKLIDKANWQAVNKGTFIENNDGLIDAILKGRVGSSYSPGIDFVGDKEFYMHMEDLIRFYLNEQPFLRNIRSRSFALPNGDADEALIKETFSNLKENVFKKVDGRGGSDVHIGPLMTPEAADKLVQEIRLNPGFYKVQDYTQPSHLLNMITDIRVEIDVSPKGTIASRIPWGRGAPVGGSGKVNISSNGRQVTVLVVEPKNQVRTCKALFH